MAQPANAAPLPPHSENLTAGAGYMLVAMAVIAGLDAVAKLLVESYPVGQVMFFRSVVSIPLLLSFFAATGQLRKCVPRRLWAHVARATALMVAMWSFLIALRHMSLIDATVLAMTAPLFITALSVPLLGEQVGWRRWAAVLVGFLGVVVMLRPDTSGLINLVALLPVLAAFGYAMLMVLTKRFAATEPVPALILSTQGAVLLVGGITWPFGWEPLTWEAAGWFLIAGAQVSVLAATLTLAYVKAPASMLAPLEYTAMVWAALFGWIGWRDVPGASTLAGAAIIVLSGLYVFHRERMRKVAQPTGKSGANATPSA
ncbi:MAG: DMT family transporter [Alphaproteobacteria bacterium]|nr:DMT family transporter [Alphaproteobacteria bacterium]